MLSLILTPSLPSTPSTSNVSRADTRIAEGWLSRKTGSGVGSFLFKDMAPTTPLGSHGSSPRVKTAPANKLGASLGPPVPVRSAVTRGGERSDHAGLSRDPAAVDAHLVPAERRASVALADSSTSHGHHHHGHHHEHESAHVQHHAKYARRESHVAGKGGSDFFAIAITAAEQHMHHHHGYRSTTTASHGTLDGEGTPHHDDSVHLHVPFAQDEKKVSCCGGRW